jgi:hypothetical protein
MPSSLYIYSPLRFFRSQKLTPPRAGLIHRLAANHPIRTTPSPACLFAIPAGFASRRHYAPGRCGVLLPCFLSPALSLSLYASLAMLPSTVTCRGHADSSYYATTHRTCRLKLCTARWMGVRRGEADILFLFYRSSLLRKQCVALLRAPCLSRCLRPEMLRRRPECAQMRRTNQAPPPSEPSPA